MSLPVLLSLALVWGAQSEEPAAAEPAPPPQIPSAAAPLLGWHPQTPEDWEALFPNTQVQMHRWDGLELWSDDRGGFADLVPVLDTAWQAAGELLGADWLPEGAVIRVVLSEDGTLLPDYFRFLGEGAQKAGLPQPPASLLGGAQGFGSARWNLPATVLLNTKAEGRKVVPTRAVHEVGVLLASWASSWSGYAAPEFLAEGLAGMLVRRAVKRPAALVYHDRAALSMTIHGYGVFAGLGEAMNDSSNAPDNWPRLVHRAFEDMRSEQRSKAKRSKADPRQRIDALLGRTHEEFARADYAYAWAVMEFLFADSPLPEQDATRRAALQQVLQRLREPRYAGLDQDKRSALFLADLLGTCARTGEGLHQDFLAWSEEHLPKR